MLKVVCDKIKSVNCTTEDVHLSSVKFPFEENLILKEVSIDKGSI